MPRQLGFGQSQNLEAHWPKRRRCQDGPQRSEEYLDSTRRRLRPRHRTRQQPSNHRRTSGATPANAVHISGHCRFVGISLATLRRQRLIHPMIFSPSPLRRSIEQGLIFICGCTGAGAAGGTDARQAGARTARRGVPRGTWTAGA